jgi:hypothetical protein
MNLRQQIINDQVEKTKELLQVKTDKAFLIFTHSLISDTSIHAFSPSDDVDGGQDKQIDAITIEDNNDEAIVYITQAKNETGFSSNQIIKIRNGLNWIFNKSKTDIQTLSNQRFIDAILRYRDLQNNIGPSNIQVRVSYITNGNSKEYSPECTQEIKTILDEYDNDTFSSFKFKLIGYDELVDFINSQDKKNNKINANIKIRYDTNTPSLIKYHNRGLKGIICTAPAKEIADIVNQDSKGFVFDLNIRRFLGTQGAVNKDIIETCSHPEENHLFWFLNNGITIVCDKVDPITDPDDPSIKIENMQIVNGCQTASSLAKASRDGTLMEDARVILRIYETNELDLVDKIVLTTNNQNKINGKNLRANDIRQTDIEKGFKLYGFYYERKQRQYINDTIPYAKIAPNEIVAASYLSIVLKRPSDARSRKYKIWSEFYSKVFSGGIVEPYLISFLVFDYISEYLKVNFRSEKDEITRYIINNASFHISRLSSFYWKQNDNWTDQEKLSKEVELLVSFPNTLNTIIPKAISSLKKIIENNPKYKTDLNTALKSSELDNDINRLLYTMT